MPLDPTQPARELLLSVVVPCRDEAAVLDALLARLVPACEAVAGDAFEIVLVDDGSTDETRAIIARLQGADRRIVGVILSRAHGHGLALTAGLAQTRGARVLILDADLQDPPELLAEMMARMDEGHDVVYGRRRRREGETLFKRATASLFYRLLAGITDVTITRNAGDFRLISRRVADLLCAMPEQDRFLRGMVNWLGFSQVPVDYDRAPRHAGQTKYPLRKMIRLALDAIAGFSVLPLRIATWLGFLLAFVAFAMSVYSLWQWQNGEVVAGWTSQILVTLLMGSVQLIVIGILGEYLGRIYMQSKARPLFIIDTILRSPRPDLPERAEKDESARDNRD